MCADISVITGGGGALGVLLASGGWSPGMLLAMTVQDSAPQ